MVAHIDLSSLVGQGLPVDPDNGSEREHQRFGDRLEENQQDALARLAVNRAQQLHGHDQRTENDDRPHEPDHPQRKQNTPPNDYPDYVEYVQEHGVVVRNSFRRFEALREGIRDQSLRKVSDKSSDHFCLRL